MPALPTATRVPTATCGWNGVAGVLCLWVGKEEVWNPIPASPALTPCLSRNSQAWRFPAGAEGRLWPCFPTTFWRSAPNPWLCPNLRLLRGAACACPLQLDPAVGVRGCRARAVLAAHPWTMPIPECGVRWGCRQMSPPPQAVTAGGDPNP